MLLSSVLSSVECRGNYDPDCNIEDIVYDSRKARQGVMFVCLCGARSDGHKFVKSAYDQGCRVFLCQNKVELPNDAQVIYCDDTRAALAAVSCNFFRHPSKEMAVIGITGTKGKTTVAHIIRSVLDRSGIKCGIIGTVGAGYGDVTLPTVNTTPESYELQKMFRFMADAGCKAAAVEVSSLGLKYHRVDGTEFAVGVFTNLYPDHIGTNEHESFEEYAYWKKQLFKMCKRAIVNIDDEFSHEIIDECTCPVTTYGLGEEADYLLTGSENIKKGHVLGVKFGVKTKWGERQFMLSMPGDVNVHNALIAVNVADSFSVPDEQIEDGLSHVFVKGRAEIVETGTDFSIIIDYAHNGVSLQSILSTVGEYEHKRIIALYGSVGSRTEIRRRELGLVSAKMCDLTIITEDDPEFEDPEKICNEIAAAVKEGGGKYVIIPDRAEAIDYAVKIAEKGDIIVLAGKGHEEFMKVRGEKLPFSEKEEIKKALKKYCHN